jgi:nucleotide-binding universal stress UspA family protein
MAESPQPKAVPEFRVNRILLATDFSRGAAAAAHWAAALSRALQAELVILHVLDLTVFGVAGLPAHTGTAQLMAEAIPRLHAKAAEDMTHLEAQLHPARTMITEGLPREAILQASAEVEADLIVMGTRGRTGLARVLLGSVAEHVVRHSLVPVLTIRETGG